MFYCKMCGDGKEWPTDGHLPRSVGTCEICQVKNIRCFDVPSKNLPMPRDADLLADVEVKAMPDGSIKVQAPKERPKKKEMTLDEVLGRLQGWLEKYAIGPSEKSEDEDEYVDIQLAVSNLQILFYVLLQDHLTVGQMNQAIHTVFNSDLETSNLSDDILAAKADSLVKMIFRGKNLVHEIEARYDI